MSRGKKLEVQLFGGTIGHAKSPLGVPPDTWHPRKWLSVPILQNTF